MRKSHKSNSIYHRASGKMLATKVLPASLKELKLLGEGWLFDWAQESLKFDVYKLVTIENQAVIQGLVSLQIQIGFVYVSLVESAPQNRRKEKANDGVGGNLFAFTCKLSKGKGAEGFITFESKTELMGYYAKNFGAKPIGNSNRMFIDEAAAEKLIATYFN